MKPLGLTLLSLHQGAAPLDARERLLALAQSAQGSDRILLGTCHRVELYIALESGADTHAWVERELGLPADDPLWSAITCLHGEEAVNRLLRVAAGLESQIVGEPQIVGQIRTALAEAAPDLDPLLRRLFERALKVARSLRRGTHLGAVRRSVGSLAVDEIVRSLSEPKTATVLVIGAGEMGKLAVRALANRVGQVVIANRGRARAEAVAAGSVQTRAVSLDQVPLEIANVDAVVAAADTRGSVLTRAMLAKEAARRPLLIVDIAVPRSVAEHARDLPGLRYCSVDDLVDEQPEVPAEELADAAARCETEASDFVAEADARAAGDAIREVRAKAHAIRRVQLERAMKRLGHLTERDRKVVNALSLSLTNALLHEKTIELKKDAT